MEEVAIYLPAYEVKNLVQKLVLLHLEPVCSSIQHGETDSRKTHCKMTHTRQGKLWQKKRERLFPIPSSASSY